MDGVYTAASEAKWFEKNAEMVTLENLREGDFIFYCFGKNQRYKNIDHVAIYVGDGKVIDASMSIGYVVYRDLYDIDKKQ